MAKRSKTSPAAPKKISFEFIKSNFFRVVRGDGVIGGLAPNGSVHLAVYSERQPIPKKMVHFISENTVGPEIMAERESRTSIVRELEVDVVMDITQALVLRQWLDEKIKQYEALVGPAPIMPATPKAAAGKPKPNGKRENLQ